MRPFEPAVTAVEAAHHFAECLNRNLRHSLRAENAGPLVLWRGDSLDGTAQNFA